MIRGFRGFAARKQAFYGLSDVVGKSCLGDSSFYSIRRGGLFCRVIVKCCDFTIQKDEPGVPEETSWLVCDQS